MDRFEMNGVVWGIIFVEPDNPVLIDRTNTLTLACTDPVTKRVYISNRLRGKLYFKVLMHELGHCALVSYGLLDEIHEMVIPEYWIPAEEFICNFIAEYGLKIIKTAENIVKVELVKRNTA